MFRMFQHLYSIIKGHFVQDVLFVSFQHKLTQVCAACRNTALASNVNVMSINAKSDDEYVISQC